MSKDKKITVGALNITMHPHSPDHYVRLLRKVFADGNLVHQWGNRKALLGAIDTSNNYRKSGHIAGELFSYVDFDPNEPWVNLEKRLEAEEGELQRVSIPKELRPSLRRFSFILKPETHRIFIETYSSQSFRLSIRVAAKVFDRLFSQEKILAEFGKVEVQIEPDKAVLDNILSMSRLDTLTILIKRPNSDDGADIEKEVFKRLEESNAESSQEVIRAQDHKGLTPSASVRKLSEVAASNGYVRGHGRDESGEVADKSTQEYPLERSAHYDPNQTTVLSALLDAAENLIAAIKRSK